MDYTSSIVRPPLTLSLGLLMFLIVAHVQTWIMPLSLPPPPLTSLGFLMLQTIAHRHQLNTGRNLSLPLETVTNIVKHKKTFLFSQKPEYLHVVNHSAVAQLRGIKVSKLDI